MMIKQLHLEHYKAFEAFDVHFRGGLNVMVGPNGAGKSTIVGALRLCDVLLRLARRVNPTISAKDRGRSVLAYPLASAKLSDVVGYTEENIRFEFRIKESRLDLEFQNGAKLYVVWPVDGDAFFYLDSLPGMNVRTRAVAATVTPDIGIVPTLSPIENQEEVLTENYLRKVTNSRLRSRHFRNYLHFLKRADPAEFDHALEFIASNTPEIQQLSLRSRIAASGYELDLFFIESGTKSERELFWAGDGLQIWIQTLFQLFTLRTHRTIVLDEPDIFLHPDLQRRLVNVLELLEAQVIVATHAPEILTECSKEAVIWVDRSRRRGRRARDTGALSGFVTGLGSSFDLSLARTLRSRVALFVEGDDMKLLKILAGALGLTRLQKEGGKLAVVPLGGYNNWPLIEPFAWMKNQFLDEDTTMYVILDRDYRRDEQCFDVVKKLDEVGVSCHIWNRKELESYLLPKSNLARVAKLSPQAIDKIVSNVLDAVRPDIESSIFSEESKVRGQDPKVYFERTQERMHTVWDTEDHRLGIAPPKKLISMMNVEIAKLGGTTMSPRKLADSITPDEIDRELANVLQGIDALVLGKE